jgi:uncharacterized Zn finger protein
MSDIELRGVSNANLPVMFYIRKCPKCSEHALIVPAGRLSLNKVKRHVKCDACGYVEELKIIRKGDKGASTKIDKKK